MSNINARQNGIKDCAITGCRQEKLSYNAGKTRSVSVTTVLRMFAMPPTINAVN